MGKIKPTEEQHTAGPIAIGFDYQFYYFMFLALELSNGQKIGFEVKDDGTRNAVRHVEKVNV